VHENFNGEYADAGVRTDDFEFLYRSGQIDRVLLVEHGKCTMSRKGAC